MNTLTATLWVLPDGTCQGLYTEVIDLSLLGRLQVERATSIEFVNSLQAWRVFDRRGRYLYSSPSREVCLAWEQRHLCWEHQLGED